MTVKTYSIRVTKDEHKRIMSLLVSSGYSLNSLAKTVLFRITQIGMSDYKQQPKRLKRRGKPIPRSERLHFKLDPTVVDACKATLKDAGFSFSEVMRAFLQDHKLLFSRPKKYRNRESYDTKDFYQTPYPITEVLAAQLVEDGVSPDTPILDPCCGQGAILDVLRRDFPMAWGFDKFFEYECEKRDFFEFTEPVELIVTNPPFLRATDFIIHSMKFAKTAWFMLPLDYATSRGRLRIFQNDEFYCSEMRVLSRSPVCLPEKKVDVGECGKMTYAWFAFKQGTGETKMAHFDL